ncbi:hypothetical protein B9Z19DRAFT_1076335 [Tuber borchii]|uniref:Uncharacterized protein n=1 Tax=Tuber borchii TaxID=42251 RepID=A0A2T7A246_TUBBO|nr:hypothetical protein B9Z19DRAFT_1076335 [Tuber borchii]
MPGENGQPPLVPSHYNSIILIARVNQLPKSNIRGNRNPSMREMAQSEHMWEVQLRNLGGLNDMHFDPKPTARIAAR